MADFDYASGDLESIVADSPAKASIVNRMFTYIKSFFNSSGWVDTDKLADGAVTADKLGTVLAGNGLERQSTRMNIDLTTSSGLELTGAVEGSKQLQAKVDDSTIEIDGGELSVKDEGITPTQLASGTAGHGIDGGAGVAYKVKKDTTGGANIAKVLNVIANGVGILVDDDTIGENGSGQLEVKDAGITSDKIENDAIDSDKIDTDAVTPAKISALYTGAAAAGTKDVTFGDKIFKFRWMRAQTNYGTSHDFSAEIDWSSSEYFTIYVTVWHSPNSAQYGGDGSAVSNLFTYVDPFTGVGAAGGYCVNGVVFGADLEVLAIGIKK